MRFDNEHFGMLAPTPEQREAKPIPVFQPNDVSDAHWAIISADTSFMSWIGGMREVSLRFEKIAEYAARLDRVERSRASDAALNEEMRRQREADAKAANPTDAMRIASLESTVHTLEADAIVMRTRFSALEAAFEELLAKSKPAKVSRGIFGTTTTTSPPKDAA